MIGFCDAILVAPLGDEPLAAASTGALNFYAFVMLPMGVAFIVQSFAAQLKGKNDLVRARRYAWYGLAVALVAGLLALAFLPLIGPALGLLAFTPRVRELQTEFLQVRLLSVGSVVATEAIGNWFSGLGNTRYPMRAGIIAMATNVPLAFILIHGHLGVPALGVRGAALGNVIASWIGFGYMVFAFRRNGDGRVPGKLGLGWAELRRVLRFGLPHGLNWFLEFAAFAFFINMVMTFLGTVPLAALNVVFSVNSVSFMPAFGVATAGAILVGQMVGAGQPERVGRILLMTAKVTGLWMGVIGLSYVIAPRPIFGLFVSSRDHDSGALLAAGATMLALSTTWQLFDAMAMTLSESLRATGDTVWCLRARLVLAWGLWVPVSYLWVIRGGGGMPAAIACLCGYMALLGAAFFWRFRSGGWKKIKLVEELPKEALEGS